MNHLTSIIFAAVMGCLMSLSITFVTTFVRVGLIENFFWVWMEMWLVAYPVAVFCILIYKPFASKLTTKLIQRIYK